MDKYGHPVLFVRKQKIKICYTNIKEEYHALLTEYTIIFYNFYWIIWYGMTKDLDKSMQLWYASHTLLTFRRYW